MPIAIYSYYTRYQKRKRGDITNRFFLLRESDNITWTYIRNNNNKLDYDLNEQTEELLEELNKLLGDKEEIVTNTIRTFGKRILDRDDELNTIDVIIRRFENEITFTLTYEGKLINPITEDEIKDFADINSTLEYTQVLGFNRTFIHVSI